MNSTSPFLRVGAGDASSGYSTGCTVPACRLNVTLALSSRGQIRHETVPCGGTWQEWEWAASMRAS